MFSTRSANDVFAAKFTDPLRAVLAGNISDSGPVFETVGRLWSAAEIALEQLPEAEAHKSTEGAPLADDVKDAVSATTEALWRAVEPLMAAHGCVLGAHGLVVVIRLHKIT